MSLGSVSRPRVAGGPAGRGVGGRAGGEGPGGGWGARGGWVHMGISLKERQITEEPMKVKIWKNS